MLIIQRSYQSITNDEYSRQSSIEIEFATKHVSDNIYKTRILTLHSQLDALTVCGGSIYYCKVVGLYACCTLKGRWSVCAFLLAVLNVSSLQLQLLHLL